jgi:hypothetical protein
MTNLVEFQVLKATSMKIRVSIIRVMIMALIMEAVRISETSVYSNETARCYIPEGCKLHEKSQYNLSLGRDLNLRPHTRSSSRKMS